jgi:hypothetical protein
LCPVRFDEGKTIHNYLLGWPAPNPSEIHCRAHAAGGPTDCQAQSPRTEPDPSPRSTFVLLEYADWHGT